MKSFKEKFKEIVKRPLFLYAVVIAAFSALFELINTFLHFDLGAWFVKNITLGSITLIPAMWAIIKLVSEFQVNTKKSGVRVPVRKSQKNTKVSTIHKKTSAPNEPMIILAKKFLKKMVATARRSESISFLIVAIITGSISLYFGHIHAYGLFFGKVADVVDQIINFMMLETVSLLN